MIHDVSMIADEPSDAELVQNSLAGNPAAFGEIVARYQTLICSLTYSGTGSLGRSEDVAQEVFVTAWKQLRQLREPEKLRAWLCAIARRLAAHALRRELREPVSAAEELNAEAHTDGADPSQHTMKREEERMLWQSLEQIPEAYREPLILFYREGQSIERVADALELSEDAAKQRLARGRKMLHERVGHLVEGMLRQSTPGRAFTLGVIAALPLMTTSAAAAALGTSVTKGTAAATGASMLAVLGALIGPVVGCLGAWMGVRASLDSAQSERERQFVRRQTRLMLAVVIGFLAVLFAVIWLTGNHWQTHPMGCMAAIAVTIITYVVVIVTLSLRFNRIQQLIREEESARVDPAIAARHAEAWKTYEYKSSWTLLGLPLVHVRTGRRRGEKLRPAVGWIAVGDLAIGVLCSVGGIAFGGISIGGISAGAIAIGGASIGVLSAGGFAIGLWTALGGLAIGYLAHGGCALAWHAAAGGVAAAREFAEGGTAFARHANDEAARQAIESLPFFKQAEAAARNPLWFALIWLPMLLVMWQAMSARKALRKGKGQAESTSRG